MVKNEIHWVAGLLEGEGSFIVRGNKNLTVVCQMADEDVIRRLHAATGIGHVTICKLLPHRLQTWRWQVTNRRLVIELITKLHPLMGRRRASKIDEMLEFNAKNPKRRQEKGMVRHGTRAMYSRYACRCEACKLAEKNYKRPKYVLKKALEKNLVP